MRNILFICVMTAAICLAACGSPDYPGQLLVADSLCETNPHKATAALSRLRKDYHNLNKASQWYYRLLSLKAKVKTYTPFTSADSSEVVEVLHHYERGGDRNLLPYAYFYAGLLQRDLNNAPMATDYLQKALNAMPDTTNLQLRSAINFRTGFLLLDQNIYDEALQYFKEAYRIEKMRKDTAMMVYCLEKIAYTYDNKCLDDSALYYYDFAIKKAKTLQDAMFVKRIMAAKTFFFINRNEYEKADSLVTPILNSLTPGSKEAYYILAAKIRIHQRKTKEAEKYCKYLLESEDILCKQKAAQILAQLHTNEGDNAKAMDYIKLYEKYSDSVENTKNTETVAQINASYNYKKYRLNNKLTAQNTMYIILCGTLFILLLSICIIFIMQHKASKHMVFILEEAKNNIKQQSCKEIADNKRIIGELKSALNESKQKIAKQSLDLDQQKIIIEANNNIIIQKQKSNNVIRQGILESDIYHKLQISIKNKNPLTDNDWEEIETLILHFIPNFKTALFSLANISLQEFRLCMLLRIGSLNGKDIATLIGRTDSAVSKSKKKLQNLLIKESTNDDVEDLINNL